MSAPEPTAEHLRPVSLLACNLDKIHVREWGLPHTFIGKMWRSERNRLIVIVLPHEDPTKVRLTTRRVVIADRPEQQWMPREWREAAAVYRADWPASAPKLWRIP